MPKNLLEATRIIPRIKVGAKPRPPKNEADEPRQDVVPYNEIILSANNLTLKINTLNVFSSITNIISDSSDPGDTRVPVAINVNLLYLENPSATPVLLDSAVAWLPSDEKLWAARQQQILTGTQLIGEGNMRASSNFDFETLAQQLATSVPGKTLYYGSDQVKDSDKGSDEFGFDGRKKFTFVSRTQPLYLYDQAQLKIKLQYLVDNGVFPPRGGSNYNNIWRIPNQAPAANLELSTRGSIDLSYVCSYEEIE